MKRGNNGAETPPNWFAIALLRHEITKSGLSNRQYAERILMRDERTLRRWLSGKQEIPRVVYRMLVPTVSADR